MSDRTKELILKTLLIIDMILMFMVFPGSIFWSMLITSEEIHKVCGGDKIVKERFLD